MPKTDIKATPPMIADFTDSAAFNAAYERSRPPQVRAVIQAFDHSQITVAQRAGQMNALATEGFLIDAQIDAFDNMEESPWSITLERIRYGTTQVSALNGAGVLPVPPDLTPYPDPPVKVNEFVAELHRSRMDYITNYGIDPGGDVYNALPRGWQCGLGVVVVEKDGDGKTYKRIGQVVSGDFIAQFMLVPDGTVSTAQPGLIPIP